MTDHRARFLQLALHAQALRFGEFTLKSVSYTHLDVYKRQGQHGQVAIGANQPQVQQVADRTQHDADQQGVLHPRCV